MKSLKITNLFHPGILAIAALLACPGFVSGGTINALVDDFGDAQNNSLGIPRQFITDATSGGGTTAEQSVSDGILSVKGDIVPPRGQPGWASCLLILDPQGLPQDTSEFEGIRLLVRINKGNVSISANSTDIKNFDYHAAPIVRKSDGEFHEVKIPFTSMKRAWSEQTPLNTKTINSLSIVAVDIQKGSYDYEIKEIGFY
jgi:hypothetical protein